MRSHNDDAQLLADFLERSDPEAFAALVARLGPSVLRVCRTVLYDGHLAEDAFQATFLTLFQKAGTIQDPQGVRAWACGTAYKTAARMRGRSIRLSRRERSGIYEAAASIHEPESDSEIFSIVREELDGLPAKYRAPLILCYLEGLTHEQAASQLGWASGTVKVRLVRGRRLLRERLDRRKIALSASLILLWGREAGASQADLLAKTARAACVVDRTVDRDPGKVATSATLDSLRGLFGPLDWAAICRVLLVLIIATAAMATAAGSMIPTSPPPQNPDADGLPENLKDLFRSDCS